MCEQQTSYRSSLRSSPFFSKKRKCLFCGRLTMVLTEKSTSRNKRKGWQMFCLVCKARGPLISVKRSAIALDSNLPAQTARTAIHDYIFRSYD